MNSIIAEARKSKGLTQFQVAEKISISPRNYQRYEKGECIPRLDTAVKLSVVLSIPLESLIKKDYSIKESEEKD